MTESSSEKVERSKTMPSWVVVLLVIAAWLVLTQYVFPKLGVPT